MRTLSLGLALLLLVSACTGGGEDTTEVTVTPTPITVATETEGTTPTAEATPTPTPTSTPTSTSTPEGGIDVVYFLVRDGGDRLWVEPGPLVERLPMDGPVARTAITNLLEGPEGDTGLVNPVPDGTELLDIAVTDGVLVVDLSAAITENTSAGAATEEAFAQALAHTGGQFSTVDAVQLQVEGEEITDLWGHVDWSVPVEPDPFWTSPIVVSSAGASDEGDGLGTIELAGTSRVFEAVFLAELRAGDGTIIEERPVMAECSTGCPGAWTLTFEDVPSGSYVVALSEEQIAEPGEGFRPYERLVRVVVP